MLEPGNPLRKIFLEALETADPDQRNAFLDRACGANAALRREVEELLVAEAGSSRFLPDRPLSSLPRAHLAELAEAMALGCDLPSTEQPGDHVGRYKLLQKIGEGGCGVVYLAEQQEPIRRSVALKVIKLGMDTRQVIARFAAERQALALMDHPHIAKVLDAGATDTGRPFFVMELVRGLRITDHCDQHQLDTRARLQLFLQVCHAAQHAHDKGVVHRDIKPSNILVTPADPGTPGSADGHGVPKVIDFGIAKATEGRLTDHTFTTGFHQFLGTPAYMSPEQAAMTGAEIDPRSDIYSLGVLLYELLTGKTPFDTKVLLASGLDSLRQVIREQDPARPSTRIRALDPTELSATARQRRVDPPKLVQLITGDLDSIVVRCLEKEPGRRYQTARELAEEVERFLRGEPIRARPVGWAGRTGRWCRRKPVVAGLAAAIALLLGTVLVGSPIALFRIHRSQQETVRAGAVTQRNLVGQYVANGTRLMNDGDLFGALLWYTEALKLDAGDPAREEPHRIRIASVLGQVPKLINVFTHGNLLYHANLSPDDQRIATCSDDHTARIWDVESGRELARLQHEDEVFDVSFNRAGDRLVTASADGTARLWDGRTGAPQAGPMRHPGKVWTARFFPDGKRIATGGADGAVRVWDATTGAPLGEPMRHDSDVWRVRISPDGEAVAGLDVSPAVKIWSATGGKLLFPKPGQARTEKIQRLNFTSDSRRFVTSSGEGILLWDSATMAETGLPAISCGGTPYAALFSPDNRFVVGTSWENNTMWVWDSATAKLVFPTGIRLPDYVLAFNVSPDSRKVVTGAENRDAQLWSLRTGQPLSPPLKNIMMVKWIEFSSSGRRMLIDSCDQAARVWDLATSGEEVVLPPLAPGGMQLTSPDGSRQLTRGEDRALNLMDGRSGTRVAALQHSKPVQSGTFSPDGRTILTTCQNSSFASSQPADLHLWDAATGRHLNEEPMGSGFLVHCTAFSPDSSLVAVGGMDFMARVWDARTGRPITQRMRHDHRVGWVGFSPDGKTLATACWDKSVRLWDSRTGEPLTAPLRHSAIVYRAIWGTNLHQLFTLTENDQVQGWDLRTGDPLTPPLRINKQRQGTLGAGSRPWELPGVLRRDDRPVADLLSLARMLAVGRVDASGSPVPLNRAELTTGWSSLRARYPLQFATTTAEAARWHRKEAADSEAEGEWAAARFHLERWRLADPSDPMPQRQLTELAAAASQPGEMAEAAQWQVGASHRIPPRDPRAGPAQIDLAPYCNLTLSDSLAQQPDLNGLFEMPPGLHTFQGVRFDIRGVVHLSGQGAARSGRHFPERVEGIRIGRKCRTLQFVQATSHDSPGGTTVGSYVLHYADGQRRELPVVFGRDIGNDWFSSSPFAEGSPSSASTVWTGSNPIARVAGSDLRLYRSTRDNPLPNVEIVRIDFVSAMAEASPYLVALTVE